jgi:cyclopropane-fatty-acyl-phospholipid synthase
VRFCDYRDVAGTYDRIVSIEMIEAVGEAHWPAYFATLRDRLAPGGEAIVQAITIAPDLFERYRRKVDFIQRYIFPGGMLPTEATMAASAGEAGLTFERVETFGQSYAWTLADWRMRFEAAWPEIARMGFDERFRRMWHYYLTYCEAGFERGAIDVGLYRFKKPQI